MSPKKIWHIGEIVRGFKPKNIPEGTMWVPYEGNEKGTRAWELQEVRKFESEAPFFISSELARVGGKVKNREVQGIGPDAAERADAAIIESLENRGKLIQIQEKLRNLIQKETEKEG